jgi:hypothetical protein
MLRAGIPWGGCEMKVRVPVIVQDPEVVKYKDIGPTEDIDIEEDMFLDGPVSPRVAVLDFDPESGFLEPAVRFIAPEQPDGKGSFKVKKPMKAGDMKASPEAAAVSVFGTVYKTMKMFEEADGLGRKVRWAFEAPQLLLVPHAGEWANAYYERESHSLQFFYFTGGKGPKIHTCLSQDIVAHEAAHALIDGVAQDLYDAITPQSLAIHEALADLGAMICSLRSDELAERVLTETRGSIDRSTVFSGIAEQFGEALRQNHYLRDLNNDKTLSQVDQSEPHDLSEVLSGCFYHVFVKTYDELSDKYRGKKPVEDSLASPAEQKIIEAHVERTLSRRLAYEHIGADMKALYVAGQRMKRMLLRGLDYLPPADVTFFDFARAVVIADLASHPESKRQRDLLCDEFVKRGIATSARDLLKHNKGRYLNLGDLDLEELKNSNYAAYTFARKHRCLLGIPRRASFEVRPRLDVTKSYYHRDGNIEQVRECLFKVSWSDVEKNARVRGKGLPPKRRIKRGTTLAIEWLPRPRVRAILTSTRPKSEIEATDKLIQKLVDKNLLRIGSTALGRTGQPWRSVIQGEVTGGSLRIRNAGRMLHITREG